MEDRESTLNGVRHFFGLLLSVVSGNFGIVFQFHGFLCMNQRMGTTEQQGWAIYLEQNGPIPLPFSQQRASLPLLYLQRKSAIVQG